MTEQSQRDLFMALLQANRRKERAEEEGNHALAQRIEWAQRVQFETALREERAKWEADWQRQRAARAAWLRQIVGTAIRPVERPRERRDASGRSSAKSGDSGSDDPPGDRPAPERGPAS